MVDKRKFKDINVSLLGLGTMRLPCETEQKRESNPNIDYDKAQSLVDLAYKNGVNYFDTAYMYHCGKSEAFIGYALKKYARASGGRSGATSRWRRRPAAGITSATSPRRRASNWCAAPGRRGCA